MRLAALTLTIILLAVPLLPVQAGHGGLHAALAPTSDPLPPDGVVNVTIWGQARDARHYAVALRLDSHSVGQLIAPVEYTGPHFGSIKLNATHLPDGWYVLSATVFTDYDPAIDVTYGLIHLVTPPAPTFTSVNASYDHAAREFVVTGVLDDPDADVLFLNLTSSLGNVTLADPPLGPFELRLPGDVPSGVRHDALLRATDGRHSASQLVNLSRPDRPAQFDFSRVAHEMGGRLVVEGRVTDEDGPVRIDLLTPRGAAGAERSQNDTVGPNATSYLLANGTFRLVATGLLDPGEINGTVVVRDEAHGSTGVSVTFHVVGVTRVHYDRTISLNGGAYVNEETVTIPWLHNATVSVCVTAGTCAPGTWPVTLAGGIVFDDHGITASSPYRCLVVNGVRQGQCQGMILSPGMARFQWAVAGFGEIRVRLTGTET